MYREMANVSKQQKSKDPMMDQQAHSNQFETFGLTPNQQDIWMEQYLYSGTPTYNIGGFVMINGPISTLRLENAINRIIQTNDAMRLKFLEEDGVPYQRFHACTHYSLQLIDVSEAANPEAEIRRQMTAVFLKPFSTKTQPLFRFLLFKASHERYVWFLQFHHLITDGWGISLVIKRVIQAYNTQEEMWPDAYPSYLDAIAKSRAYLDSTRYEKEKAYWSDKFLSIPEPIFPKKQRITKGNPLASDRETIHLDRATYQQATDFANEHQATTFHFLLAAFFSYFRLVHGKDRAVVGLPILNRKGKQKKAVGLFTGIIPLVLEVNRGGSSIDLMKTIKNELFENYRHQQFPLSHINQLVHPSGGHQLFDITLSYERHDYSHQFRNFHTKVKSLTHLHQREPLNVFVREFDDTSDVAIDFDYQLTMFNQGQIQLMTRHFVRIVNDILTNPHKKTVDLSYMSEAEQRRLTVAFNQTETAYQQDLTLIDGFLQTAHQVPERVALVRDRHHISYEFLAARVARMAAKLHHHQQIKPGTVVAISLPAGPLMMECLLAIHQLQAAAFLVDPNLPETRKRLVMCESGCTFVIVSDRTLIQTWEGVSLNIDHLPKKPTYSETAKVKGCSDNAAMILFTSGSTGKPKGVALSHRNIMNVLTWFKNYFNFNANDVIPQKTTVSFVDAIVELFLPLTLSAGAVHLRPYDEITKELHQLFAWMKEIKATVVQFVPTVFDALEKTENVERLSSLRVLILSGEPLRRRIQYPGLSVFNLYGSSECTALSSAYKLGSLTPETNIPIGQPIANTQILILNDMGRLCPLYSQGEIHIAGDSVAMGYLNETGADKFAAHPFKRGERVYATGDLGYWNENSEVIYLGRKDNQVKVRGNRVAPGEIEHHLKQCDGVDEAVVTAITTANGQELAAYLVGGHVPALSEIQSTLTTRLPDFMIPSYMMELPELPLTFNGKVDKRALPDPRKPNDRNEIVPPRNDLERKILTICKEVLKRSDIGVFQNFFELGGHSLKATHFVSRMRNELGIDFTLKEVFEHPKIADLAKAAREKTPHVFTPIEPSEMRPAYQLSSAQKRLWLQEQMEQSSSLHNMSAVFLLEGKLHAETLNAAFTRLIGRHEILRTIFITDKNEPLQKILEPGKFSLRELDFTEESLERARLYALEEAQAPFDLETGPLMRVSLLKLGRERFLFVFNMHHIISDGWSIDIIVRELTAFYQAERDGDRHAPKLTPLPFQYKDYALWHNQLMDTTEAMASLKYWTKKLARPLPFLDLPLDFSRPIIRSIQGDVQSFEFHTAAAQRLAQICERNQATLFMGLVALVRALLHRYTGQEDIILGTPIAGRSRPDLVDQVGFYVNNLALRTTTKGKDRFTELLAKVKQTTLEAYEHQDYPFDRLADRLVKTRDPSRSPLFDVMVVLRNTREEKLRFKDVKITPLKLSAVTSGFDMTFHFTQKGERIKGYVKYNTGLFTPNRIARMVDHLHTLLDAINKHPQCPVNRLKLLDESERHLVLESFNRTDNADALGFDPIALFRRTAEAVPDRVAARDDQVTFTYREASRITEALASLLWTRHHLEQDSFVALVLGRSAFTPLIMLGVAMSNAAYVPIDPDSPNARIHEILAQLQAKVVITEASLKPKLPEKTEYLLVEDLARLLSNKQAVPPRPTHRANLLYAIYTSGSTGSPRGVLVSRGSFANLIFDYLKTFKDLHETNSLVLSNYAFDATIKQLWLPLFGGGTVHVIQEDLIFQPDKLWDYCQSRHIRFLNAPISLLKIICEVGPNDAMRQIEYLMTGAERMECVFLRRLFTLFPSALIVNGYGPTETTVAATSHICRHSDLERNVPIGKPMTNTRVMVMDTYLNLSPVGVVGEICIAGRGLARGYLNQPHLTAQKFIPNPHGDSERLYTTGDLGRWLMSGELEFLGRQDHQVKIRGYRVECGEIEAVLRTHHNIKQVLVHPYQCERGSQELAAYFTYEEKPDTLDLRGFLKDRLPHYMIPAYWRPLTSFPMTPNGKIDLSALQDMIVGTPISQARPVTPRNDLEMRLAQIWSDMLNIDSIGVFDDFFELGGQSLKASRLIGAIRSELGVELQIKEVFQAPTIAAMAGLINKRDRFRHVSIPKIPDGDNHHVLSHGQKRLWVLSRMDEKSTAYNMPAQYMITGALDTPAFERAFKFLADRHEILRTRFVEHEGEVKQQVLPQSHLQLVQIDVSSWENPESLAQTQIQKDLARPFNLEEGPLIRARLIKIAEERHALSINMHHIISDGLSLRIFFTELSTAYCAFTGSKEPQLPRPGIQYRDFAAWQHALLQTESAHKQRSYWCRLFSETPPYLDLPTDLPRPLVHGFNGKMFHLKIPDRILLNFQRLVRTTKVSLFVGLSALLRAILFRYTGQNDITFGVPVSGRNHPDLDGQIGFYVNTLALRLEVAKNDHFHKLLASEKDLLGQALEHQWYPFDKLVEDLAIRRDIAHTPLFDVMLVLQQGEMHAFKLPNMTIKTIELPSISSKFDLTFAFVESENGMHLAIEYNTDLFKPARIGRMGGHLLNLMHEAAHTPNLPIQTLPMLGEEERREQLSGFLRMDPGRTPEGTMHQLLERQARLTPARVVLANDDWALTYIELNQMAERLAVDLRHRGVGPEMIVAMLLDQSEAYHYIAMAAILKAGGAFLPLDPAHPPDHLQYVLNDSGCRLILTQSRFRKTAETPAASVDGVTLINLDEAPATQITLDRPHIDPKNAAYVIYTSGSTGRPKGVILTHDNFVPMIKEVIEDCGFEQEDRCTQFLSTSFDASLLEMWMPFSSGGKLLTLTEQQRTNTNDFVAYTTRQQATVLMVPPSFMRALDRNRLPSVRIMITGGEPAPREDILFYAEGRRFVNEYGITETTVSTIHHVVTPPEMPADPLPIGRPIHNAGVYVLNNFLQLVPLGVVEELWIAGPYLARGYLGKPARTADAFRPNPFGDGERLYRTGDLARRQSDGTLEILGRVDHQVKIRGHRIECGAIESVLHEIAGITNALVMVKRANETKLLTAYYSGDPPGGGEKLRNTLHGRLPDYMIPSHFVRVASWPLGNTGKINREALPEPECDRVGIDTNFAPPRNQLEKTLTTVWQQVLGRQRIGIKDRYFDLGGDSIKAIQIISRLSRCNLKCEVRHLFQYPTIEELVRWVKPIGYRISQEKVSGKIPLTPIQRWFFEGFKGPKHHFNQAVLLHGPCRLAPAVLKKVLHAILEHHDALRMVFLNDPMGLSQINRTDVRLLFETVELRHVPAPMEQMEKHAERIQAGFSLEDGPLLKGALFRLDEADRLLIVIHHLVVDGVSWRILLEDISLGYEQALQGYPVKLPHKTTSFKAWSTALQVYSLSEKPIQESGYWDKVENEPVKQLPADYFPISNLLRDRQNQTFNLDGIQTETLLTRVNHAYNTGINDILLAALGRALRQWTGNSKFRITLESHGREDVLEGLDISRTVGWFTSMYPVLLDMAGPTSLDFQIKAVKEILRRVPHNGFGYGMLRYLSQADHTPPPISQILFNFLGQFDQELDTRFFHLAPESVGHTISPMAQMSHDLDISTVILSGQLRVSLSYNPYRYNDSTVTNLMRIYEKSILEFIHFCAERKITEPTPSDFTYSNLSLADFKAICTQCNTQVENVKNIYRLSPLQEGLLFHNLYDKSSAAYFEQMCYRITGIFKLNHFEETWRRLIERHDILRTAFVYEDCPTPLQIVLKSRPLSLHFEDLRAIPQAEVEARIAQYREQDISRPFELSQSTLMRFKIFQTGETGHRVVWSFHHILMDGWCLGILHAEFLKIYRALNENKQPALKPVSPYSRYILWLDNQDRQESGRYWYNYLNGYERMTGIPRRGANHPDAAFTDNAEAEHHFAMDHLQTEALKRFARVEGTTINTVLQCVWAILLSRYNDVRDVVFGVTVAGRPDEVEGIEQMIGLFINTVPTRIKTHTAFENILSETQSEALNAREHHHYPLSEIQAASPLKQNLFDHIMVFENYPLTEKLTENTTSDYLIDQITVFERIHYEFGITVIPGETMHFRLSYNAANHPAKQIEAIERHFINVLGEVLTDKKLRVQQIELLSPEEKRLLLATYNDTKVEYQEARTIMELLSLRAREASERDAINFQETQLTYAEVDNRANQIARTLISQYGVQAGDFVGVLLERSEWLPIVLMGILRSGGVYVPIDPDYPRERIDYLMADSKCKVLLVDDRERHNTQSRVLLTPSESVTVSVAPYSRTVSPEQPAYLIYTSGSTGRPKGVQCTHRCLYNLIQWQRHKSSIPGNSRTLQYAALSFDVSIQEMGFALGSGGSLTMIPNNLRQNMLGLTQLIASRRIELLTMPFQALNLFFNAEPETGDLTSLKHLITSGEQLKITETIRSYLEQHPDVTLHNQYGPSESHVVTAFSIKGVQGLGDLPPIGKPLSNTEIYILDSRLDPMPIGSWGEIIIGGSNLAVGYLNNPAKTAEQFIPSPFSSGGVLYKSGDIGRYLPNGNIDFQGRNDDQIKVRGYRIECGEVAHAMMKHPMIEDAAVIATQTQRGENELAAYFVGKEALTAGQIRGFLANKLPNYMIPVFYIPLKSLPQLPSGKIDRQKLPSPDKAGLAESSEYTEPLGVVETKLAAIWRDILERERIGAHDNFFDLGGHSLKAIKLCAQVHKIFRIDIPLMLVFRMPTIAEQADFIQNFNTLNDSHMADHPLTIFNTSAEQPVLCFPPGLGFALGYNELARQLPDHRLLCFNFIEHEDPINQYIKLILENQPKGPYNLMGYSAGGNVAFKIAAELERSGYRVANLILWDVYHRADRMNITESDLDKQVAFYLDDPRVNQYLTDEKLVEGVTRKIRKYAAYWAENPDQGTVDANIHLIKAIENTSEEQENRWQAATTGVFRAYHGSGKHGYMLEPRNIHPNAKIMEMILLEAAITPAN